MIFQQYIFIVVFFIFVLDLFLAASKTGLMNARLPHLLTLREQENIQFDRTLDLLSSPSRLRGNFLVSQSLFRFLILGSGILWFIDYGQPKFPVLVYFLVILITAIILGVCELIVEISIIKSPAIWSVRLTTFTRILFALLSPILFIPGLFVRAQNDEPSRSHNIIEDELLSLLDASEDEGGLEQDEKQMIKSIFPFFNHL